MAFHGIRTFDVISGARPTTPYTTSVIGIVGTATDADGIKLPVNTPVSYSQIDDALDAVGTLGTLVANLEVIRNVCQPRVVIVRVDEHSDANDMRAAMLAGIKALESAASSGADHPRIIIAGLLDEDKAIADQLIATSKVLNGTTYVTAVGDSIDDAVAYRNNFGDWEIELAWPNHYAIDYHTGAEVERPTVALHAALRALVDETLGYHHSKSNIAVGGVTGLVHNVSHSISSNACDSARLNEADITTIIKRDGWRLWGLRNCSSEPKMSFEVYVRTDQILKEIIADGLAWAAGKPIDINGVKSIIETINQRLRQEKLDGHILGGRAWFAVKRNTNSSIEGGKLAIRYAFTPKPPLEELDLYKEITNEYITDIITNFSEGAQE